MPGSDPFATVFAMNISSQPAQQLRLTNDGGLSLYFIGTGSAFAKTLNQTNAVVVKGDAHVVIDFGTRCSQALHSVGVAVPQLRNFVITHSHADHIGGLEEVMMFGRYIVPGKPNMVITTEYETILWEQSLRGGTASSERAQLGFSDFWNVIRPRQLTNSPRETWEADVEGINVKMPRTKHIPDSADSWEDSFWSCGIIIDDRVLYTSDTRFDPDLLLDFDERYHFEVIFHDCQLFKAGVHASIEELATLPAELKSRMVLMHYGDNWQDFRGVAQEAGFHSWARQGHHYNFD